MSEENTKPVLVRMPPSPTGGLHLGTARTALFNWLFAKKHGGEIIFRWEDTDLNRSKPEHETSILEGLKWLGMDFEKEAKAFYRQTDCAEMHQKYLKQLWEEGKVFPCFTTQDELQTLRDNAAKSRENFVFWSPFRDLPRAEAEEKMNNKEAFVWRLKVEKNKWVGFKDLIRKKVAVNTDTLGDFAIARSDNSVLYYLANVIDDWKQGVTHVIRGEDHISNTPKQILLYEALGAEMPKFGHIPLVLDKNKKKLSKRNVDPEICVLIPDFQKDGFIPEGVINGLVFLGWHPKTTEEVFSMADLEKIFDLKNVNAGAAQYDFGKMQWFNAHWMRKVEIEKLQQYFAGFSGETIELKYLDLAREKARNLVELAEELKYLIGDLGFDANLFVHEKMGLDIEHGKKACEIIHNLLADLDESEFNRGKIREICVAKIAELEWKNGPFMWPFRVALSNQSGSAGPFEIAEVIGKDEALKRLKRSFS